MKYLRWLPALLFLFIPMQVQAQACSQTLQNLVDNTPANGTLLLPPCTFRETATVNKPMTINGQGKAEIRGSDVWAFWTQSGGVWVSQNVYPNVGNDSVSGTAPCDQAGPCYVDRFRAFNLEQVFVDGTPLVRVQGTPTSGQFALDANRRVLLGSNPNGRTVEVSTRKRWLNTQADNVTLTNLTMKHASTAAFESAISNDLKKGWTLQNSRLSDSHGSMIGVGGNGISGTRLLGNTITNAGNVAVTGYQGDATVIQGNTFVHTGYGGWEPNWQSGAVKIVAQSNAVLDGNAVSDSFGMGLWCDIGCSNVTFSNNKIHDVGDVGIHYEISTGCRIYNNAVWNTGGRQGAPSIYVSNAGNCEVDHNVVYNARGHALFMGFWQRGDSPPIAANSFHDNDAVMTQDAGYKALGFEDYTGGSLLNGQQGSNNGFWYGTPEGSAARFSYGSQMPSLAAFNATPGGSGSAFYLTNAQKDQILAQAGILGTPATPTPIPPTPVPATPTPKPTTCEMKVRLNGVEGPWKPCL